MLKSLRIAVLCAFALAAVAALSACGEQNIDVAAPYHRGAELFSQRCTGCHTLSAAATHGSASNIRTSLRNQGPNFNVRHETVNRVLYAIRNGGFSGAIMPQNVVVGPDALAVARFVARYAGRKAVAPPEVQQTGAATPPAGGGSASGGGSGSAGG